MGKKEWLEKQEDMYSVDTTSQVLGIYEASTIAAFAAGVSCIS